jgi:uncharacterized protein
MSSRTAKGPATFARLNWKEKRFLSVITLAARQGYGKSVAVAAETCVAFRHDPELFEALASVPRGGKNRTFIMAAARAGDLNRLIWLRARLRDKKKIDDTDSKQRTALHHAAACSRVEIVSYLLENKAAIEARDRAGRSPLWLAAKKGQDEAVAELLQWGANGDARSSAGSRPVHISVTRNHKKVLAALAPHVDLDAKDSSGHAPLMIAVLRARFAVMKYLLARGVDKEARDNAGGTPLMAACSGGNLMIVKTLLRAGCKPNVSTNNDWDDEFDTPFKVAILDRRDEIAIALLDAGLRNDEDSTDGSTLLHTACLYGREAIVRRLLKSGANVMAINDGDITRPLSYAARCSNSLHSPSIIRRLCKAGAAVNETDDEGKNALHWAAMFGLADNAKALLECGARVDDLSGRQETALSVAVTNDYLFGRGDREAVIKVLLAAGAQVNACNSNKETALHKACKLGLTHVATLLLESGGDLTLTNKDRKTPLDLAREANHGALAATLEARAASIKHKQMAAAAAEEAAALEDGNDDEE